MQNIRCSKCFFQSCHRHVLRAPAHNAAALPCVLASWRPGHQLCGIWYLVSQPPLKINNETERGGCKQIMNAANKIQQNMYIHALPGGRMQGVVRALECVRAVILSSPPRICNKQRKFNSANDAAFDANL